MDASFQKIIEEYNSLTQQLTAGGGVDMAKIGKRQSQLAPLVEQINRLERAERDLKNSAELANGSDELAEMAREEMPALEAEILRLRSEIEESLLPRDPSDDNDCIVEMRAGAGGDESTLFAAELFRAYGKYAEEIGFTVHVDSSSRSDAGGFKEIIFEIAGRASAAGPYSVFKYESGVHRVQRVPETEKNGRVHTSTITVAVLPKVEEKDFAIADKDLKIEATTSSGHGGQSVNTTYSAVRIVHIPTGITAQCQDERSFTQNKEKAMDVIRARVAAHYREIEEKKVRDLTKSQIGTGDRSEKIRTYNFPQDRVTDHRINQNFNQITLIMEGKLEPVTRALQQADVAAKKQALKK